MTDVTRPISAVRGTISRPPNIDSIFVDAEFRRLLIKISEAARADEADMLQLITHIDDKLTEVGRVPEGFALMPIEPTEAMVVAIEAEVDNQLVASGMWARDMYRQDGSEIYRAMLSAVPSPPQGNQG